MEASKRVCCISFSIRKSVPGGIGLRTNQITVMMRVFDIGLWREATPTPSPRPEPEPDIEDKDLYSDDDDL